MNQLLALAAAAALLVAPAVASAEDSIHISTVGKSPQQVHAEIVKAAQNLCARDNSGAIGLLTQRSCVEDTVKSAITKSGDPTLTAMLTSI